MKQLFEFLLALRENNNRDWFEANRKEYLKVREDFENLVTGLIASVKSFDPSIGELKAKECMFRIYRDVRFSHDKSPYKTHMGAFIAGGGRKSPGAGYYFHLEPGNTHIGGGIYRPEPEALKKIRQEIYFNPEKFRAIVEANSFKKVFGKLSDEDSLKRPPRDFPADYPHIGLLMYRSYICGRQLSDQEAVAPGIASQITDIFKTMHDLNLFLNSALNAEPN